jgi:hypothetical protein
VIKKWDRRGLEKGAIDKGGPEVLTDFGPNYYVAYLIAPDGWQIELVFKTIQ